MIVASGQRWRCGQSRQSQRMAQPSCEQHLPEAQERGQDGPERAEHPGPGLPLGEAHSGWLSGLAPFSGSIWACFATCQPPRPKMPTRVSPRIQRALGSLKRLGSSAAVPRTRPSAHSMAAIEPMSLRDAMFIPFYLLSSSFADSLPVLRSDTIALARPVAQEEGDAGGEAEPTELRELIALEQRAEDRRRQSSERDGGSCQKRNHTLFHFQRPMTPVTKKIVPATGWRGFGAFSLQSDSWAA